MSRGMVIEYFPVGSLMLFILPEVFLSRAGIPVRPARVGRRDHHDRITQWLSSLAESPRRSEADRRLDDQPASETGVRRVNAARSSGVCGPRAPIRLVLLPGCVSPRPQYAGLVRHGP